MGKSDWGFRACRYKLEGNVSLAKRVLGGVDYVMHKSGIFRYRSDYIWVDLEYTFDERLVLRAANGKAWECVVPVPVIGLLNPGGDKRMDLMEDIALARELTQQNVPLRLHYNERNNELNLYLGARDAHGSIRFTAMQNLLRRSIGFLDVSIKAKSIRWTFHGKRQVSAAAKHMRRNISEHDERLWLLFRADSISSSDRDALDFL